MALQFGIPRGLLFSRSILLQVIAVLLLTVLVHADSGYFSQIDKKCSIEDSCQAEEFSRTCSCDIDCHRYGTCCFDAPSDPSMQITQEHFKCYADSVSTSIYVKTACSPNYEGSELAKTHCESPTLEGDLMSHLLVTSNRTNVTYWNWNCALCNNEIEPDLVFWSVQSSCDLQTMTKGQLTVDMVRRRISYFDTLKQWGVLDNEDTFVPCPLFFYHPASVAIQLKTCAPNMISTCPSDWTDNIVRQKCGAHYAERFGTSLDKSSYVYYKNVHCAICNGVSPTDVDCRGRASKSAYPKADLQTLRVSFNFNPSTGEHNGGALHCSDGYRYDPFFKVCRSISKGIHPCYGHFICGGNFATTLKSIPVIFVCLLFLSKTFSLWVS